MALFLRSSRSFRALPAWLAGWLLLFAWPICEPLRAEQAVPEDEDYLISLWSAETGMPAVVRPQITQAPEGFLWLVGEAGLLRFDGMRWRILGDCRA